MCVVSAVGDIWQGRLPGHWPSSVPYPISNGPPVTWPEIMTPDLQKQIAELRGQVEQMRKELEAARAQDVAEGNPDCEMEEKVVILKAIAKAFGIDLSKVFPND